MTPSGITSVFDCCLLFLPCADVESHLITMMHPLYNTSYSKFA